MWYMSRTGPLPGKSAQVGAGCQEARERWSIKSGIIICFFLENSRQQAPPPPPSHNNWPEGYDPVILLYSIPGWIKCSQILIVAAYGDCGAFLDFRKTNIFLFGWHYSAIGRWNLVIVMSVFLCSPKNFGRAYSRRFFRPSVRPSFLPPVRPSVPNLFAS